LAVPSACFSVLIDHTALPTCSERSSTYLRQRPLERSTSRRPRSGSAWSERAKRSRRSLVLTAASSRTPPRADVVVAYLRQCDSGEYAQTLPILQRRRSRSWKRALWSDRSRKRSGQSSCTARLIFRAPPSTSPDASSRHSIRRRTDKDRSAHPTRSGAPLSSTSTRGYSPIRNCSCRVYVVLGLQGIDPVARLRARYWNASSRTTR
jgi:hypothetical protein